MMTNFEGNDSKCTLNLERNKLQGESNELNLAAGGFLKNLSKKVTNQLRKGNVEVLEVLGSILGRNQKIEDRDDLVESSVRKVQKSGKSEALRSSVPQKSLKIMFLSKTASKLDPAVKKRP